MRRITRRFISIFILSLIVSCATKLVVDYDYDTTYDFTKPRTYNWIPTPPGSQLEDMTEKRLTHAVNTQLQAKGYSQSSESPDFLISMQGVKKSVESGSTAVGASIGIPVGRAGTISVGGGKSKPRVKEEGTLTLDFLDRATNTLIWQGTATAAIQPKSSPDEQQQRINQVIAELLKNFPPQQARK